MLLWGLNSRKQQLWLLFGILLLLAAVGVVAADQAILRDSRILPNVFVAYIDVGGMTREEAEIKIQQALHSTSGTPVMLTDQREVWFVPTAEIDFKIDVKKTVDSCMQFGRGGDFMQRWHDRLAAREH